VVVVVAVMVVDVVVVVVVFVVVVVVFVVVVVVDVVVVVVEVVVVVTVVVVGGQGFGEQVPDPTLIPPSVVHWAGVSTMHTSKAPVGEDCLQH
jgi:hypothetical protein